MLMILQTDLLQVSNSQDEGKAADISDNRSSIACRLYILYDTYPMRIKENSHQVLSNDFQMVNCECLLKNSPV